ncbi:hypothetical protein GCK72_013928 [Caenorhabditis remanei]|uniref:Uncharacterized protein n=1 Tax=Caenorhabditis remanei TaxID=31234 RepID=A0A6A5GSX8_CAERE|nr:hypothetical protein GCK72_013928 [Caenorhabditis remanei]KAF1757472.1 hypothetical protein GCK72_013928 [Caenorhabditis remanei]
MLLFILFALASISSASIFPLSAYTGTESLYKVNKTHQIYIISNSPQEDLQLLTITTNNAAQNSNGFTLAAPTTDGSLTPFVPTQDNDLVSVVFTGKTPLSGWLYMNSATPKLNVFPLLENSSISFKQGTNVFFKLSSPAQQIPVAQNVVVEKNQPLYGFIGLPDDIGLPSDSRFFDSSSIDTVTNYNQLELPLDRFYFSSSSSNVKYEIKFGTRSGMTIGSSGLVMTDGFPTGAYGTRDFNLNNQNGINVDAYLVPRFDQSRQFYSTNVTVFMTPTTMDPTVFPVPSYGSTNITSNSPMSRILIESDGPFAIQYTLRDTTVTTPSPFETTTKSSSFPQIIASLLLAAIFRF